MPRSTAAIQADLDAAYALRTRLLKGGAQSVTNSAAGAVAFITLDQVEQQISGLKEELRQAIAILNGEAGGSFVVHQITGTN